MKTNRYTQFILTIIAICLLVIAFRETPIIQTAHAQQRAEKPVAVNIVEIDGRRFAAGASLPVEAK